MIALSVIWEYAINISHSNKNFDKQWLWVENFGIFLNY